MTPYNRSSASARMDSDRKLVIFDMDKTLVDVSRHHIAAYSIAMQTVFGVDGEPDYRIHPGNTQANIMRAICLEQGVPERIIDERLDRAMDVLASEVTSRLATDLRGDVLPGVNSLLEQIRERCHALALATGSITRSAEVILERARLADYFPACAFGDEVDDRESLLRLAVERARTAYGLDLPEGEFPDLVVVGDAPRDVEAGRALGARVIAVATGYHSVEQLGAHGPDVVLASLEDWRLALSHILGDGAP